MSEEKNHDSVAARPPRTVYVRGHGVWPTLQHLAARGFSVSGKAGEDDCLIARRENRVIEIRRLADGRWLPNKKSSKCSRATVLKSLPRTANLLRFTLRMAKPNSSLLGLPRRAAKPASWATEVFWWPQQETLN